jgi:pentapeptide MXKDX repeat protein
MLKIKYYSTEFSVEYGWNWMEWDAMGCDKMQWDAMGCDGMRWDAMGCDGI